MTYIHVSQIALMLFHNISFQVCTNVNRCFCNVGFTGPDCSIEVPITTYAPTDPPPTHDSSIKMEKKETPYGKKEQLSYEKQIKQKNKT